MQYDWKRDTCTCQIYQGRPSLSLIFADDASKQNFAEALPTEMSLKIFSELDVRSLCSASLTCKQWNDIIEKSDHLWRSHCQSMMAVCHREVNGDRQNGYSWKVTLVRNYRKGRVKRNWLKGRYSNIHAAEELPANSMCPLDVETWGEILEAELER
ncbi:F-box only protein 48 [Chanos chanos]|uniref:F-box only protein 48 n=1 Tax=Chanos chanos TaxID=29144 RepID=A0A6J2VXH1_CHACN|nr:F-box only protein 48 [Chanos chanos]XP_030635806.1 F-box only protein 48 [Chanos chanos]